MQRPKLTYHQCDRLQQKLANFSSLINQLQQNDYRLREHKRYYGQTQTQQHEQREQESYPQEQQQQLYEQKDKYFYPLTRNYPKTTKATGKQNLFKRRDYQQNNPNHQQKQNNLSKCPQHTLYRFYQDELSRIQKYKQRKEEEYCSREAMKHMKRNKSDIGERKELCSLRQISLNQANYDKPRNGAINRNPYKQCQNPKQLNRSYIAIDPKHADNSNYPHPIKESVHFNPDIQRRIKHVESVKLNKAMQDDTWGYSIIESKVGHIQGSLNMDQFSSLGNNQCYINKFKRKDQNQSYDQNQLYLNQIYGQNQSYLNHSEDVSHYQTQTCTNELSSIGNQHERLRKNYDSYKQSQADDKNSIHYPSYHQRQSSINQLNGQIKQIMSKYDYEFRKQEISSLLDNQRITLPSMRKLNSIDNIELQLEMIRRQREMRNLEGREQLEEYFSPYQNRPNYHETETIGINNIQRQKARLQGNFMDNQQINPRKNEENVFDKIELKSLKNQEASSINHPNQEENSNNPTTIKQSLLLNNIDNPKNSNFTTTTKNGEVFVQQHTKNQFITYRQKRTNPSHQQNSLTVFKQQSKLDTKIQALNRKIKQVQDQKRLLNIEFKPFKLDNFISKLNSKNSSSNHTRCQSQQLNQAICQPKIIVLSPHGELYRTNQNSQNEKQILIKVAEEHQKNLKNQNSQTSIDDKNLHGQNNKNNSDKINCQKNQLQTNPSLQSQVPITTPHENSDMDNQSNIVSNQQLLERVQAGHSKPSNEEKTSTESTVQAIPFQQERPQTWNQTSSMTDMNNKNRIRNNRAQIKKQLVSKDNKANQIQRNSSKLQQKSEALQLENNHVNITSMNSQKKLNKSSLILKKTCNARNELEKLILLTIRQIELDHEFRNNKIHFEFNFEPDIHSQQQSQPHLSNMYHELQQNSQKSSIYSSGANHSSEDQTKWELLEFQFCSVRNKKVQELRLLEQLPQQERSIYEEECRIYRLIIQVMDTDSKNLHKVFSLNVKEHDPFSAIFSSIPGCKDDQIDNSVNDISRSSLIGTQDLAQNFIRKLVKSYISSYTHFYKHIYKQFNAKELISNGFKSQVIDVESKGYVQVNDLVRFFNISTNSMHRNRDFIMLFNRIRNSVQRLKENPNKIMLQVDTNVSAFLQDKDKDVFKRPGQKKHNKILAMSKIRFKQLLYVFCPTQRL